MEVEGAGGAAVRERERGRGRQYTSRPSWGRENAVPCSVLRSMLTSWGDSIPSDSTVCEGIRRRAGREIILDCVYRCARGRGRLGGVGVGVENGPEGKKGGHTLSTYCAICISDAISIDRGRSPPPHCQEKASAADLNSKSQHEKRLWSIMTSAPWW